MWLFLSYQYFPVRITSPCNTLSHILRRVPSPCGTQRTRASGRLSFPTYVCICTKTISTWASGTDFPISTILLVLWSTSTTVSVCVSLCETDPECAKTVRHNYYVWSLGNGHPPWILIVLILLPLLSSGYCQTSPAWPKMWHTEACGPIWNTFFYYLGTNLKKNTFITYIFRWRHITSIQSSIKEVMNTSGFLYSLQCWFR